ncbi:MAG: sodium:solute symporter [Planctomycetota bacterium]
MNMHFLDWTVVLIVIVSLIALAIWSKKYTQSVADFLAANRCGGRYLMTVAHGMSALAVVNTVARFEMYYKSGFVSNWWNMSMAPLSVILMIVGYQIYRFRETRVLTTGQFFEIRYSKSYRKFMGVLGWLAGVINFGIFPAVGGRFFIYFCGLPKHFTWLGVEWSVYVVTMVILLGVSLLLTLVGGQIAVMITDFAQGSFCNIALIFIVAFVLIKFPWNTITEAMAHQPEGKSLLNPFDTTQVKGFSLWYFLLGYIIVFFNTGSIGWQGSQGYNVSARDAHELRMSYVLGFFRAIVYNLMVLILAIAAYVVMHHEKFHLIAQNVHSVLGTISTNPNDTIRNQVTVSVVLTHIFPVGMVGVICAIMFAAFVSTHDTYMHGWGSVLVQDVILPFRTKPFTPKQHLLLLRLSIVFITIFIFCFALLFKQNDYIFMFMYITGAIGCGGISGPIIGGLYWKRGTTTAAWASTIYGTTLAIGTIVIRQLWPYFHNGVNCPWNSYYIFAGIVISSAVLYILVSLLGRKEVFNLERMLHRGKYALKGQESQFVPRKGLAAFGFSKDISWKDKGIFWAVGGWFFVWLMIFTIFTIYHLTVGMSDEGWSRLWQILIYSSYCLTCIVTVWFLIGGIKDCRRMFADLKAAKRNDLDDGMVVDHRSLCEEFAE